MAVVLAFSRYRICCLFIFKRNCITRSQCYHKHHFAFSSYVNSPLNPPSNFFRVVRPRLDFNLVLGEFLLLHQRILYPYLMQRPKYAGLSYRLVVIFPDAFLLPGFIGPNSKSAKIIFCCQTVLLCLLCISILSVQRFNLVILLATGLIDLIQLFSLSH